MKRLLWIPLVLWSGWAWAHPVDECLQAAYLKLSPNGLELELELTPGERVAPQMLKLIDQNKDGSLGQAEVQRYAQRVLDDLRLSVDGQLHTFKLEPVVPPQTNVFLAGGGMIKVNARANLTDAAGAHTLEFRNAHVPVKSGYLANVFVQSERVGVKKQSRNQNQSDFRVEYSIAPAPGPNLMTLGLFGAAALALAAAWVWWKFRSRKAVIA